MSNEKPQESLNQTGEPSILEVLRSVHEGHTMIIDHNPTHARYCPIGKICHEAGDKIEQLEAENKAMKAQLHQEEQERRNEQSLLMKKLAESQEKLQKSEEKVLEFQEAKTKPKSFCAYCGAWGNHTSGGCELIKAHKQIKQLTIELQKSEAAAAEMREALEDISKGNGCRECGGEAGMKTNSVELHQIKERPILFSGSMVRAILEGRKTQTRRVIKPQPDKFRNIDDETRWIESLVPKYNVHDKLWVRETWFAEGTPHGDLKTGTGVKISYRADDKEGWNGIWRPSIFMPRWASRISLEIEGIKAERLQDISEEDARAEGIREVTKDGKVKKFCVYDKGDMSSTAWSDMPHFPSVAFSNLWDSINAKCGISWESNPWVWAITFKVL